MYSERAVIFKIITDAATDEIAMGRSGIVFIICLIPECGHRRVAVENIIAVAVHNNPVIDAWMIDVVTDGIKLFEDSMNFQYLSVG